MFFVLLILTLLIIEQSICAPVITEISYNPRGGDRLEFIEFYNPDANPFNLAGHKVPAVNFTFPNGASIAGNSFMLLCRDKARLAAVFAGAPNTQATLCQFNDYAGNLDDSGEEVELLDVAGTKLISFEYNDKLPWDPLADGLGSTLELICPSADPKDPDNWRASAVPVDLDPHVEHNGSPGMPALTLQCPPWPLPASPPIFVTEIHYHPFDEPTSVDQHEFVEILSRHSVPVPLTGWRLVAEKMRFQFPPGTEIKPNERVVVAKDPTRLRQLYGAEIPGNVQVLGPYTGELSNGADKLALVDDNGRTMEYVSWDDNFPWPVGADSLGEDPVNIDPAVAGDPGPLPQANLPMRGLALQRRRLLDAGHKSYNWRAELPTPGTPHPDGVGAAADGPVESSNPMLPRPTDIDVWHAAGQKGDAVREGSGAKLEVRLEPGTLANVNMVQSVTLEWFTDNRMTGAKSAVTKTAMARVAQPTNPAHVRFEASVPTQGPSTVVRYRIVVQGSGQQRQTAPRPRDPIQWHAYFHQPVESLQTESRTYHMFVTRQDWDRVIANSALRRTTDVNCNRSGGTRCCIESRWNERVKITLAVGKKVFDAEMRLQGSRWNRDVGVTLSKTGVWAQIGPVTGTFKGYSYRFSLPKYVKIDGRDTIILSAMKSQCTMLEAPVHYRLARKAGMIASKTRYVRLHANGQYLRYMLELTRGGDSAVDDFLDRQNKECWEHPTQVTGDLFKAQGLNADTSEGPYGVADMRQLNTYCQYSPIERYEWVYGRKTNNKEGDHVKFKELLDGVNPSDKFTSCSQAERQWVEDHFDVGQMATYIAVNNYAGEWDGVWHNQFMYMRVEDSRWTWAPWDADWLYSDSRPTCCAPFAQGSRESLWVGEVVDNHRAKKAVSLCFRDLVKQRYRQFLESIWAPAATTQLLDELQAEWNQTEVNLAHGSFNSFSQCMTNLRSWFPRRFNFVNSHQDLAGVVSGQPHSPCPSGLAKVSRKFNQYRAAPGQPPQPRGSSQAAGGPVTLEWGRPNGHGLPSDQILYEVQSAATADFAGAQTSQVPAFPASVPNPRWVDPQGPAGGQERFYRVRAKSSQGLSPWSLLVRVVGGAGVSPTPAQQPTEPPTPAPSPMPTPVPCPMLVAQCQSDCQALNQVVEECGCENGAPVAKCRQTNGQQTPAACLDLSATCNQRCPDGLLHCACDFALGDAVATCVLPYTLVPTGSPTPWPPFGGVGQTPVGQMGGGPPGTALGVGPLVGLITGLFVCLVCVALVFYCLIQRKKRADQRLGHLYFNQMSGPGATVAQQQSPQTTAGGAVDYDRGRPVPPPHHVSTVNSSNMGYRANEPKSYVSDFDLDYGPDVPAKPTTEFARPGPAPVAPAHRYTPTNATATGRAPAAPRTQWNSPRESLDFQNNQHQPPRPIPRPPVASQSVAVTSASEGYPCPVCGNQYATPEDLSFHRSKRNHW